MPTAAKPPFNARVPIYSVMVAVACALVLAILGPRVGARSPPPSGTVVAERTLKFEDRADGAVVVKDGATQVAVFEGEQGFLRGVLRGLVRQRRGLDLPHDGAFHLVAYNDGRFIIEDPASGERIELEAFGTTNLAVFAQLLPITVR